ncbi:UvrD-helicase domain-containing protein [Kiritimatiellaeota bacterium B1221]|nr:UvrD-helicase domain-containing protein [Kiritimatiellaeota bacterium B1221]
MNGFLPYLCISASAGSGKTFQLSRRVLRLLAMQAEPDSIAAYTFSRKAAGEIFDSIVSALRLAASSDEAAAATSEVMALPHAREDFIADLRRWFQSLHRLRIGTLDSRISQMLSAVSVELGLPPEFSLLDTQSAEYMRLQSEVMNQIFKSGSLTPELTEGFLQLFFEATHGASEKNFMRLMENFLGSHRATFLTIPQREAWQGPDIQNPPQKLAAQDCELLLEEILDALPSMSLEPKVQAILAALAVKCARFQLSSTWTGDLPTDTLSQRLLSGEGPEVKYGRKMIDLSGEVWEALSELLTHVLAVALEQVKGETLALYGFLRIYQLAYQGKALNGGQLAFEDACMLMADFDQLEPHELAYRLDGEISHWLLDEFQDTNRLQWKVLEPFVSEVLQDPEAQRSFFYVGDVKQAIYGWRGGDSELFGQVLKDWPVIEHESMAVSYRSSPAVLDLVNQVFSDVPVVDGIPAASAERWNREFELHQAAREDLPGQAEVWQIEDKETDPHAVILEMVRRLPPEAETAILVRTNDEGKEIADVLRAGGFRVSQEGSSPLRDDTAVEAVLAVLRQAAHPLDEFSPHFLKLAGIKSDPLILLEKVQNQGFTPVIREIIDGMPLTADAQFSRGRLDRLLQVAIEFDRLGDPSIDRFLAFVEKARPKESEARGVVRIMTIHQSKGLGFDAVILPVKKSSSFSKIETGELVKGAGEDGEPCISLLPPKMVCERIPEFHEMREKLDADKTYEGLCGLYVALTRAKQSLQVLLPVPPKSGGSLGCVDNWLADRLGSGTGEKVSELKGAQCLANWGGDGWKSRLKKEVLPEAAITPFQVGSGRKTLSRLEPSQEASQAQKVDQLFHMYDRDGRDLGSRVHALMEEVDWAESVEAETLLRGEEEEVVSHVTVALGLKEMKKPLGVTGLWREQRFETVLPEGWVTGIFDRVVLFADGAWIQDFKTNQSVNEATVAKYTPQMQLYRRVLADMLGFDEGSIKCQLLFTRTGEVVEV